MKSHEIRIHIDSDSDIVTARQKGRGMASELGFTSTDLTLIATAISELARNIVLYAHRGEIVLSVAEEGSRRGIGIIARDDGPGIADVERALQEGFSTSRNFGLGLSGVRRLVDEFKIASQIGSGTTVSVKKWKS